VIASRLADLASFDAGRSVVADLLGVLRRRKGTVAVVLLAVVVSAYATLTYLTEQFEADARLLVMLGRENVEAPVTVTNGSVFTSGVQEEEVNSYIQLLQSRALAEETVDAIGIDRFSFEPPPPTTLFQKAKRAVKSVVRAGKRVAENTLIALDIKTRLSDREKVVKMVQRSLRVSREGRSNVIHLALRLPDAELARATLEAHIEGYFRRHIRLRQVPNIVGVFGDEAAQYREELERLQHERTRVRETWGVSSVEVQRGEMVRRLNDLLSSLDGQRAEAQMRRSLRDSLARSAGALPDRIVSSEAQEPNPLSDRLVAALNEVRMQRISALTRFREDTSVVRALDEQIAALEGILGSEDARRDGEQILVPNPTRQDFLQRVAELDAELSGLDASVAAKAEQADVLRAELQRLNEGEEILHLMDLERSLLEQKYLSNAARRDQARFDEGMNTQSIANVTVLSPPVAGAEPASPRKMTILGVSVLAGLFLGLGVALLMEWADDTIYDPEGVSRPGDPPFLGEFLLG
jgi:uncharacterized protein involved in exopolysaccharide biosynthesis